MPIRIEHAVEAEAQAVNPAALNLPGGKLYIKSYGCQMNVYDAIRMGELMRPHGYRLVDTPEGADVVVLNTCHIREKADEKMFSDLGRFRRLGHKDTVYAIGGCVGQAMGKKIMQRAPAVKVVFGPQTLHRLPEFVAKAQRGGPRERVVDTAFPALEKFDALPKPGAYGPTAFVSIQEGCDKFCTYCVVPYTRGPEMSRPAADVIAECAHLAAQGGQEVTLLGQNVNAYTHSNTTFTQLLHAVAAVEGIHRVRFTTSHPVNMDDDLINLFGTHEKIMPYLHLPVQAGSNRILKAMNRAHTVESYLETMEKLRAVRPDIAISGDFIVGFPGETEEDYLQTLHTVAQVGYASAYSFMYSPRPGTPAADMAGQVDDTTKKERLAGLQALLDEQQYAFNKTFEGQTVEVLVEEKTPDGSQLRGRTPHNIVVNFAGHERLIGTRVRVNITQAKPKSLGGEIELVAAA